MLWEQISSPGQEMTGSTRALAEKKGPSMSVRGWPPKYLETQPGELILRSAEQELPCGQLSRLRFERYWKCPGLHVILSTTPSDMIVDA